ncbi:unnamed protein product [Peronospora destructor]|uniref:FYVE-type domain-containing protein n=1 Tax=Peronospora destructor TaxID=86335 RepID=A0AAV0U2D6_9STRA|nr:unnamed protein product [Peronospora destructor]
MLYKSGIIVPTLELERNDEKLVQKLAATLLQQNLDQYSDLAVTNDGHPDSQSWAAIQKREGIRVYKKSTRQQRQHIRAQAATGNSTAKTAKVPPSLLLMGAVKGSLDDLLYATAASSTEAMLTKSKFINDGVVASKVLARIIEPTMADPMHFLNVTWRYCALSEPRDYVCLDVAGWSNTDRGEQVAYHLIHSVGFDVLPSYEHKGIARVNMSVCWIFRQKTATLVECYARGFYDLDTSNAMLNSISMYTIASQWLSCSKLISYAQSMKLARLMNRAKGHVSSGCSESNSGDGRFRNSAHFPSQSIPSSTSSFGDSIVLLSTRREPSRMSTSCCKLCYKTFRFLGASRCVCQACDQDVCSRCTIKETLCLYSKTRQHVRESKKNFCKHCVAGAMRSKADALVRDDFIAAARTHHSW